VGLQEARVTILIQAKNAARAAFDSLKADVRSAQSELRDLLSDRYLKGAAIFGVLASLRSNLREAFEAADRLEQSQRTLAATASATGASLGNLQSVADGLQRSFKLDDEQANKFTETVARLTAEAGRLNLTQQATVAFLDLGAARGWNATETMQALENAFVGAYGGAQRLIGQNVGELFERTAASAGKQTAELTQAEKAQALLNAAMANGSRVAGEYGRWLDTAQGRTQALRNTTTQAYQELGRALESVRRLGLGLAESLANIVTAVVQGFQLIGAAVGQVFFRIPAEFKIMVSGVLDGLAFLIEKASAVLRALGVDVGTGLATALRNASASIFRAANEDLQRFREGFDEQVADILGVDIDGGGITSRSTRQGIRTRGRGDRGPGGRPAERREGPTFEEFLAREDPEALLRARGELEIAREQERERRRNRAAAEQFLGEPGPGVPTSAEQRARDAADLERVTAAFEAAAEAGLAEEIERTNAALAEMPDLVAPVSPLFAEMGNALQRAREQVGSLAENLAASMVTMAEAFTTGIAGAMEALVQGGRAAGREFVQSMRNGLRVVAQDFGRYFLGRAAGALGEGLLGRNPTAFAAAAKFFAGAALMFALSGAIGGGGVGGGAGGGADFRSSQDTLAGAARGDVTIVLEGGRFLDMSDPRQLEAFRRALEEFSGRRIIVREA
jgi:hypothetical protein